MIRPDFKQFVGVGALVLIHSAKGSTWERHKYVKRIDGTYYYPNGYEGGRNISSLEGSEKDRDKTDESDTDSEDDDGEDHELSAEDIENLAREVIRGNFGNGQIRKDLLAGNYEAIQKRVNELMRTSVGKTKMQDSNSEATAEEGANAIDKVVQKASSTTKSVTANIQDVFSVYNKNRAKRKG